MPELKKVRVVFISDTGGVRKGIAEINNQLDKLQKDTRSKYGAITSGLDKFGKTFTYGVTVPIVAVGASAINSAIQMDSMNRALAAITGSASEASKQMEGLVQLAREPGIGYKEAVALSVRLQAVGQSASFVNRELSAIGNALATVGEGKAELEGVSLQLMQMEGKGRVMQEDLRILQNYIPQLLQIMRSTYGTIDSEELQKRGISSRKFLEDMVAGLEKIPKVTSSVKNDLENVQDTLFRTSADFGKVMLPAVSDMANEVEHYMNLFTQLDANQQEFIVKAGLTAAALGPMALGFNAVVKAGTSCYNVFTAVKKGVDARYMAIVKDTIALQANTASSALNTAANTASANAIRVATTTVRGRYDINTALLALEKQETTAIEVATASTIKQSAVQRAAQGVIAGMQARLLTLVAALKSAATATINFLDTNKYYIAAAAIAYLTYSYYQHIKAVKEHVNALREEAEQLGKTATASGEYGNKLQNASTAQEGAKSQTAERWMKKSDQQIQERINDLRTRSSEALRKYEEYDQASGYFQNVPKGEGWHGIYLGSRGRFADQAKEYETQYKDLEKEIGMLRDVKIAKQQAAAERSQAQKELTDDQKKALAEAADNTKQLLQEKYVISQQNEAEKQKAQAWVEYKNAIDEAQKKKEEVKSKYKLDIDITQDLAYLKVIYKQKLADIVKEEKSALDEQKRLEETASLQMSTVGNVNTFVKRRIEAQLAYNQTMTQLSEEASKGYDITNRTKLAKAQLDAAYADIAKEESAKKASEAMEESIAKASIKGAGNKYAEDRIQAYSELADTWEKLRETAEQGYSVVNRAQAALAKYHSRLNEINVEEAKDTKDKAEEARKKVWDTYNETFEIWKQTSDITANSVETYFTMLGDPKTGKIRANDINYKAQLEEIKKQRQEALSQSLDPVTGNPLGGEAAEKYQRTLDMLKAKEKQAALDNKSNYMDIMYGGLSGFQDKVKEYKEQEMRDWKDKMRAAKEYYEFLRNQYGVTSLEGMRERAIQEGLDATARNQMPILPTGPSKDISQADIVATLQQQTQANADQVTILKQIANYLDSLTREG